jgi:hypothetical protein
MREVILVPGLDRWLMLSESWEINILTVVHTGGKGESTQWVHCEFFVSPETIHPVVTQQVRGEFF